MFKQSTFFFFKFSVRIQGGAEDARKLVLSHVTSGNVQTDSTQRPSSESAFCLSNCTGKTAMPTTEQEAHRDVNHSTCRLGCCDRKLIHTGA